MTANGVHSMTANGIDDPRRRHAPTPTRRRTHPTGGGASPTESQTPDEEALALDPGREHAVLQRVLRLLERIEGHPGAGVIGFRVGSLGRGDVVVSRLRICLVADTTRPYLGELLSQSDPELAPVLLAAREQAREQGRRFAEVILELGHSTVARIRQFLRQQCALGMISLAETHLEDEVEFYALEPDSPLCWASALSPAAADYDERLTFSLLDVYQEAADLLDCFPSDRASEIFAEFSSTSALAVLLWPAPAGDAVSVPLACTGPLQLVTELRRLAYAADHLCLAPSLRAAGVIPDVLMFGAHWNDVVCVYGQSRIALICGDDVGQRAQLANRSLGPT